MTGLEEFDYGVLPNHQLLLCICLWAAFLVVGAVSTWTGQEELDSLDLEALPNRQVSLYIPFHLPCLLVGWQSTLMEQESALTGLKELDDFELEEALADPTRRVSLYILLDVHSWREILDSAVELDDPDVLLSCGLGE